MFRIALTKGRIETKAVELLAKAGYDTSDLDDKGRKLLFRIGNAPIEIVLAKAADVITYVERGICDCAMVGKDTIMECGHSFYEVLDLGFGKCRFALAGRVGGDFYGGYSHKVIATKYPQVTREYFKSRGVDVEIVKIEGSVELAPILGFADAIVDIVETGSTLKENGLEIYEEVSQISARLIVNSAAMKLKIDEIGDFISRIETVLEENL